jgi:M6 family metalloprotease-like protein
MARVGGVGHIALGAIIFSLVFAGAARAQSGEEEYRTVASAAKAQVSASAPSVSGRTAYLGIFVEQDGRRKLIITDVDADSPAAKAGIEAQDVLHKVEGKGLRTADELRQLVQTKAPGDGLKIEVERKRKKIRLSATLGALSRPLRIDGARALLGLQIGEPKEDGAPIQRISPGSPAEKAGIKSTDMVVKVEGAAVTEASRLTDAVSEKQPGDTLTLALRRDGGEVEVKIQLDADPASESSRRLPENGRLYRNPVYRLAVIGIEYPDVKHAPEITPKHWEEAFFSTGTYNTTSPSGQTVYGSMNDFYLEQSCGALRVEGKMFDWVEVSKSRADYGAGSRGARGSAGLLTEAIDALLKRDGAEALKDFDGVVFLYAGERVSTNRGNIYWPHRSNVAHGGRRWSYFICPEGGRRMANISVFCHEFGHMLGLPDLYARPENPGSEGLGIWCAMSNQAGNGRPQHFGAWCKTQLGWLTPTVIDPSVKQKLVLAPVNGSKTECFKVLIRPDGSEYLLLENRRKMGFDASLPAEGLLIWHVVGNRPILQESHGVDGPSGPRVFPTSVPYPSGANNAFTPYTTPSSRSLLGGGLPVHITNIRKLPDGRVSFYVGYEFQ